MGGGQVEIVGAATIPLGVGVLNASIPLARLTVDSAGITVVLRSVFLGRFVTAFSRDVVRIDRRVGWRVGWADLDHVIASSRSIVMYPTTGRGCRFATRTRSGLHSVLELFDEHGMPIERVATTIPRAFRI